MFDRLLIWLDDRTAIPALLFKIRHLTVFNGTRFQRFLPTVVLYTFFLQAVTGLMLWTFYIPSSQTAWESLFHLQFNLPGGWLIRGIHHFTAQFIPLFLGLYLLGLILSGKYRAPREFVFWTALILLLFSIGSLFTGGLLSWTHSGFSATLCQTQVLLMIPGAGEYIYRILCGGADFGTLTLPRFLVMHIVIFGFGSFVLFIFWRFFDRRAAHSLLIEQIPLFSNEILKYALAVLFVTAVILLCVFRIPILNSLRPDLFPANLHLPRQASLGVRMDFPANTSEVYESARPDWPLRALYHLSNLKIKKKDGTEFDLFPAEKKYIPIFFVTAGITLYFFFIPLLGRLFSGHCLNLLIVCTLCIAFSYLTYASYWEDYFSADKQSFRESEAASVRQADRVIELCLTAGIPSAGVMPLIQTDPFLQGPVLYKQNCSQCHASPEPQNNGGASAFHCSKMPPMSQADIEILSDWLRGHWHRFQKVTPAEEAMQPIE